jgi:hypothetical protein
MLNIPVLFLFFILFTLLVPTATAAEQDSIFDLLNSTIWDRVWDSLTYNTKPDKDVRTGTDLQGWIDIVGYRNMVRINGTDYIYGDPVDCAVVEYDVWDLISARKDRWNDNVDWIRTDLHVLQQGENITATLDITMLWHHSTLKHTKTGKPYIKKTYHTETMTVIDTETIPKQFNYTFANIAAYITVYNSSFSPKVLVYVPELPYVLETTYTYGNDAIMRTNMLGEVEKSEKGVEFVNFTDVSMWSEPKGDLCYIGDCAVIRNENFTADQLNISLSTPYETVEITDYSITVVDYSPVNSMHPLLYQVMGMFIILISMIVFNIKQIGR